MYRYLYDFEFLEVEIIFIKVYLYTLYEIMSKMYNLIISICVALVQKHNILYFGKEQFKFLNRDYQRFEIYFDIYKKKHFNTLLYPLWIK